MTIAATRWLLSAHATANWRRLAFASGYWIFSYASFFCHLLCCCLGPSCSQQRHLISNFTLVPSCAEIKCSRLHFSLTGSRSSTSLKPVHLTSNLKAVRGQSGADCHGSHVRHKPLLLCFQCDIPPPLSLKGIAFNQSGSGDGCNPLSSGPCLSTRINANLRQRRPRRKPHRLCCC